VQSKPIPLILTLEEEEEEEEEEDVKLSTCMVTCSITSSERGNIRL
jgi:hypothetical protein